MKGVEGHAAYGKLFSAKAGEVIETSFTQSLRTDNTSSKCVCGTSDASSCPACNDECPTGCAQTCTGHTTQMCWCGNKDDPWGDDQCGLPAVTWTLSMGVVGDAARTSVVVVDKPYVGGYSERKREMGGGAMSAKRVVLLLCCCCAAVVLLLCCVVLCCAVLFEVVIYVGDTSRFTPSPVSFSGSFPLSSAPSLLPLPGTWVSARTGLSRRIAGAS